MKISAIADTRRSPVLPEIPTTAEAGLPGLMSTGWFALAAPPKTAPALTAEIAKAAVDVIKAPDVQAKFRAASVEPIGNSPAEMATFIQAEAQRWGRGHQEEQYRRRLRHCEAHSGVRAAVKNLRQCDGRTNGAGQRYFGVMMAS